jgi:hypothetical protein
MRVVIEFGYVQSQHPTEMAPILAALAKSKHAAVAPANLEWAYEWAMRIDSFSFTDILAGKGQADARARAALSDADKLKADRARCEIRLSAKVLRGRWERSEAVKPSDYKNADGSDWFPPQIDAVLKHNIAEMAKPPTMTADEAIKQLSAQGGFAAFVVPTHRTPKGK